MGCMLQTKRRPPPARRLFRRAHNACLRGRNFRNCTNYPGVRAPRKKSMGCILQTKRPANGVRTVRPQPCVGGRPSWPPPNAGIANRDRAAPPKWKLASRRLSAASSRCGTCPLRRSAIDKQERPRSVGNFYPLGPSTVPVPTPVKWAGA